jgi:branched-chain amino acid transport system substrate-binding protein
MQLKNWKTLGSLIGVALCTVTFFWSNTGVNAAGSKALTVGVISGFSGPYAGPAEDQWRAVELAAEEINAKGGILGRQINLVRRDDKINPAEAGKMAQDMIQNDHPDFIISANSAATVLPVNDQAKKAGVPYFAVAQNDKVTTAGERGPFTFHEALTPTMNGRAVGTWIAQHLGKRVYYLAADYTFGKDNYAAMSKAVLDAGGSEAGVAYFPVGTTDFTPFIPRLRAARADVVVCISFGNDSVNLLKQIQSFGLTRESKFFFPIMDLQADMAIGFQNLQGTYGAENFYWELADKDASAKHFVDAYMKRWNSPPSGYAGYAYSSMQLIRLGAEKAKSLDPAKVSKALEGMQYDSYKGKEWIRGCDHQAFQPIFMVKGRTVAEAKNAGREQYGLREIIGMVQPSEAMERSCKDLGY